MITKTNLVPSSRYNLKAPYKMVAKGITLHNTYNDASAVNEITYMKRNNNVVSYHIAIDNKDIVQGLPFDRNGWHAGDGGNGYGNRNTIGIEICYSKSGGARYDEAETKAIKYAALLLYQNNWDISKVWKHKNWSGKNCPHRILARTRGWQGILNAIDKELQLLKGGKVEDVKPTKKPSKPTQKQPKPSTSESVVDYLNKQKQDSSFKNREKLAKEYGIVGYKGTEAQNIELLRLLKEGKPKAPNTPKTDDYKGRRLESKINNLRFYNRPSWSDKNLVGRVNKGIGFPTIVRKLKVGKGEQYEVKNSKGASYYITANSEYVAVVGASKPKKQLTIKEMADRIVNEKNVPTGHNKRREWLGIDNATYQKVRAEVNKRFR